MIGETIFGEGLIPLSLAKTIVYAMWYAALFWLPVRAAAAFVDHWNERQRRHYVQSEAALRADSYGIGMNVLPPS